MQILTKIQAKNIRRKLITSAIGSTVLTVVYIYFLSMYSTSEVPLWASLLLGLQFIFSSSRFVLFAMRKKVSDAQIAWIFPFLITGSAFVWSVLISSAEYLIKQNPEGQIDFHLVHLLVLFGLFLSIPQNLRHFRFYFSLNVFLLGLTTCLALLPLVQSEKGLLVCYVFITIVVTMMISQNFRDWKNEKNLFVKEAELQEIIDCFPGGVFEIKNQRLHRLNRYASEKIFSGNGANLLGAPLATGFIQPDLFKTLQDFSVSSAENLLSEISIETSQGQRFHLFAFSKTVSQSTIAVAVDIQDLVDARATAAQQAQLALDKSRLATLGMMSAGIAHEISNPLALIGMIAETSAANFHNVLNDPALAKAKFQKIAVTVNRANKVINSLKNMARSHEGSPEEHISLSEIVTDAVELISDRLRLNGVHLDIKIECPDDKIFCRPSEICQVLVNAIQNSIHAVENLDERWITIRIYKTDQQIVQLEIIDSGKGIPEEIRDRITEPLFTTKGYGKGTGLGLTLSNEIMKNHGGRLYFDYMRAHTTLVLELPLKFC